jgi:hypothetical protein
VGSDARRTLEAGFRVERDRYRSFSTVRALPGAGSVRDHPIQTQTELGRLDVPGRRNVPLFYPMAEDFTDVRKVLAPLGAPGKHGGH